MLVRIACKTLTSCNIAETRKKQTPGKPINTCVFFTDICIYIYIYANPPLGPTFQGSKIPKNPKFRNSKIPKFQNSKIPKIQNSKIPKFQKNPVNFLEFPKFPKGIDYWNSKKLTGFFWNFGILEFWNFGILEFRNFGILEFWNFGILEFWNFGISEFWNFGTLEFWNFQPKFKNSKKSSLFFGKSKIPKFQKNPVNFLEFPKFQKGIDYWNSKKLIGFFWNFGILEFWNFGILEFWNFGISEFWNFGILEFQNFGILEFWNFGILEFWNFGILELWNFGISKKLIGEFWNCGIPQNLTDEFWNFRTLQFLQAILLFIHLALTNNK